MPMDRCGHRQTIGHVDPHPLTFYRFDQRAVYPAVESPTLGAQTRIEGMIDFFGDKMEDFHAVDDFERQRGPVGNNDRHVILAR